jgi:hypothetical protein
MLEPWSIDQEFICSPMVLTDGKWKDSSDKLVWYYSSICLQQTPKHMSTTQQNQWRTQHDVISHVKRHQAGFIHPGNPASFYELPDFPILKPVL